MIRGVDLTTFLDNIGYNICNIKITDEDREKYNSFLSGGNLEDEHTVSLDIEIPCILYGHIDANMYKDELEDYEVDSVIHDCINEGNVFIDDVDLNGEIKVSNLEF